MRSASILLALVVVLGFVGEAGAEVAMSTNHDYTVAFGKQKFGFEDGVWDGFDEKGTWSSVYLGPIGQLNSPFTAIQGLVGFCLIVVAFITLLVGATVRWKRKQANGAEDSP